MPTDTDRTASGGRTPRVEVGELLMRIAEDRGLTFESAPAGVTDALPELQRAVDEIAGRLDAQQRRWLAAALAALSHQVQAGTLDDPSDGPRDVDGAEVAVAVVTGPAGVLAGRRRDGIPRWVFPGGRIHDGETTVAAAVRECAEETGLTVTAGRVIGLRIHPVTGQHIAYIACTANDGAAARVAALNELVEVRWLGLDEVDDVMPDLFAPVRRHLVEEFAGR
ncbi:NUDIX hydrolase [Pseudonocardia saturnea]